MTASAETQAKATELLRLHRDPKIAHRRQRVGRDQRQDRRGGRGHHRTGDREPLDRRVVRLPGRRADPAGPDARAGRPDRRGDRPAGHRRPGGRVRRRAGDRPARDRHRRGRRQHRGPDEAAGRGRRPGRGDHEGGRAGGRRLRAQRPHRRVLHGRRPRSGRGARRRHRARQGVPGRRRAGGVRAGVPQGGAGQPARRRVRPAAALGPRHPGDAVAGLVGGAWRRPGLLRSDVAQRRAHRAAGAGRGRPPGGGIPTCACSRDCCVTDPAAARGSPRPRTSSSQAPPTGCGSTRPTASPGPGSRS